MTAVLETFGDDTVEIDTEFLHVTHLLLLQWLGIGLDIHRVDCLHMSWHELHVNGFLGEDLSTMSLLPVVQGWSLLLLCEWGPLIIGSGMWFEIWMCLLNAVWYALLAKLCVFDLTWSLLQSFNLFLSRLLTWLVDFISWMAGLLLLGCWLLIGCRLLGREEDIRIVVEGRAIDLLAFLPTNLGLPWWGLIWLESLVWFASRMASSSRVMTFLRAWVLMLSEVERLRAKFLLAVPCACSGTWHRVLTVVVVSSWLASYLIACLSEDLLAEDSLWGFVRACMTGGVQATDQAYIAFVIGVHVIIKHLEVDLDEFRRLEWVCYSTLLLWLYYRRCGRYRGLRTHACWGCLFDIQVVRHLTFLLIWDLCWFLGCHSGWLCKSRSLFGCLVYSWYQILVLISRYLVKLSFSLDTSHGASPLVATFKAPCHPSTCLWLCLTLGLHTVLLFWIGASILTSRLIFTLSNTRLWDSLRQL